MSWRSAALAGIVAILLIISLYRAKGGARESADEIRALERRIERALVERTLLQAELAHMSRREWIEVYAREELGMAPARASQFAETVDIEALPWADATLDEGTSE